MGVFLTSLHDVTGFHDGGAVEPFPAYHSKESLLVQLGFADAATLTIDYAILDRPAGRLRRQRHRRVGRLRQMESRLRHDRVAAGSGADGNGNGIVDAADYTVWRDHYGTLGAVPAAQSLAATVPEPAIARSLRLGIALLGVRRNEKTSHPATGRTRPPPLATSAAPSPTVRRRSAHLP